MTRATDYRQTYMHHHRSDTTSQELDFQLFPKQAHLHNMSSPYHSPANLLFYSDVDNDYFSQPTISTTSPHSYRSMTNFQGLGSALNTPEMYPAVPSPGFITSNGPCRSVSSLSATSSVVGSPYMPTPMIPSQNPMFGQQSPSIVDYDSFGYPQEYKFPSSERDNEFFTPSKPMFTDSSLGYMCAPLPSSTIYPMQPSPASYQSSPSPLQLSRSSSHYTSIPHGMKRSRSGESILSSHSIHSLNSHHTSLPSRSSLSSGDGILSLDGDKGRCPVPDCGKSFKDLKAHMLTHQTERPEKCPITTCDYHIKGFARKYDKNRHTLTHYKGTMVCGFCPGSGTPAEKSFNRADVFKRHLTTVHEVEQSAPNSRRKPSAPYPTTRSLSSYGPDATGKCSTCSSSFANAQDFYEHLDDCVLRQVQQEDPLEAINAKRLAEVEHDPKVHELLVRNKLPTTTQHQYSLKYEDEDDEEEIHSSTSSPSDYTTRPSKRPRSSTALHTGLTSSKGGMKLHAKPNQPRKPRSEYPKSWGTPMDQMDLKKRVLCTFDGPNRLCKDEMLMSNQYEVRIPLPGQAQGQGRGYITDLDYHTMRRAEGWHGATTEEKGPFWGTSEGVDLEVLMGVGY